MVICVLICVFAANFYVKHISVPLYPATAKIALQEGEPKKILTDIESINSNGPISDTGINTELEVLRSRDLVEKLVDTLELTSQPAFNRHMQIPTLFDRVITQLLTFFSLAPKKPKSILSSEKVRSNVIKSVLEAMEFSITKNTRVINITVITTEANLSVLIANKMATLYIENQIQVKLDTLANATEFLSKRTSELKYEFEKLKTKLTNFSGQSEIVNPKLLKAQEKQLHDLRMRILESRKLVSIENNRQTILRSLSGSSNLKEFIGYADNFRLNRVFLQYNNNKISLEDLNIELDRFKLNIEAEAGRKQNQLRAFKQSEALLTNQISVQSQELIVFQQLERETEAARLLYESFLTRLLEMNVQMGLETADGRLLSKAIASGASSPTQNNILLNAGLIGLIIAAIILLIREMRFSGYRSINDLRNNIGHSVLASVPLIPKQERNAIIDYLKDKPNSVVSEAVRNLRTSILMSDLDQIPQVIMLTSSVPKEGKTVLTFALAQNMVGLNKRVLLIEADIRRHTSSVNIDRKNLVPLLDLLSGDRQLKDVDPFVEELGFDILTATRSNINAADLFSSLRFSKLITELRENYDYILIDSPPVLSVPDARVIGSFSDANIYIVQWNKTTRAQVSQGLDMLSSVGVRTAGLVLNQIDLNTIKNYGYISQYGYGDYGSGSYYEN